MSSIQGSNFQQHSATHCQVLARGAEVVRLRADPVGGWDLRLGSVQLATDNAPLTLPRIRFTVEDCYNRIKGLRVTAALAMGRRDPRVAGLNVWHYDSANTPGPYQPGCVPSTTRFVLSMAEQTHIKFHAGGCVLTLAGSRGCQLSWRRGSRSAGRLSAAARAPLLSSI